MVIYCNNESLLITYNKLLQITIYFKGVGLNYSAPERNAPGFQIKEIENSKTQEHVIYGMGCFYELTKWIIVLIIAITLLHFFVATIFIVDGASMEPNYHSGQVVLANRFQYIFR